MTARNRFTRVVAVLCFAIVVLCAIRIVRADDDGCHHDCGGPTYNSTVIKKKILIDSRQVWGLFALGGGAYCAKMRFWDNDPCIDFSKEWKQTSREDDYVTPPSIDANVRK